jgi:hypothetical protein
VTESLVKGSMGLLLIASTPLGGDSSAWAQWGLAGMVVGYTLWRDHQRERRMSQAIDKHQAWVQGTLLNAMERNTVAMERLTTVRACPLQTENRDDQ